MKNITKGDQLMLFVSGKSIAFATAHTLTLTANTTDIASKDHGIYGAKDVGSITWEITSENLYAQDEYEKLVDAMMKATPVDVAFANAATWTNQGIDNSTKTWTPDAKTVNMSGKALITSLVANANTGENATFSVTLTGVGAITKSGTAAAQSMVENVKTVK